MLKNEVALHKVDRDMECFCTKATPIYHGPLFTGTRVKGIAFHFLPVEGLEPLRSLLLVN